MIRNAFIRAEGMGGFLNPPGHPEYDFSVAWGRGRDEGSCSLSHAVGDGAAYLPEPIVQKAKAILQEWEAEKPRLTSPEIANWIHQVLGYFKNCYRNPAKEGEDQWSASDCIIENERNAMAHADEHLGVRHIRRFYPYYKPTQEDFDAAYWGEKPLRKD